MPVDFESTSLREGLAAADFDSAAPAFFSWLGVVPYLERSDIEATLRFVASLPRGTTIVFDYGSPPSELSWIGRLVFKRIAKRLAAIGEPWKTFFASDDLLAMLRSVGFSSAEDLAPAQLNARYFSGRTDGLRVAEMAHIAKAVV